MGRGFSSASWLYCSLLALIAHLSPYLPPDDRGSERRHASILFTIFLTSPPDLERFFQAAKRQIPSFSEKFHPSMQNRSVLQLIYHHHIMTETLDVMHAIRTELSQLVTGKCSIPPPSTL